MTRKLIVAAAVACAALPSHGQESPAARSLAATCAACHGSEGRSATQEAVSLAGLPREQIVSQMRAFRDGTRASTIMQQIAKGYSDQQIDVIADYFARRPR
jgi:sulfide dehydrogenase cytochrome subunit